MLKVQNVSVWRDTAQILFDSDLHVDKGEIVCLLGPNGAGKSTMMNAIIGRLSQKTGTILLEDKAITHLRADQLVRHGMALSPEGRQVFAPLSVYENLTLGAYARPRSQRQAVKKDLEWVFELFPKLKEREQQQAGTLSGGEQQMLAIGRALMSHPRVLLLDEPSLGLAPKIVSEIFDTLQQLGQQGITILLAEQNARMAFKVAQRAYILSEGKIITTGRTEDLVQDPSVQQAYLGV